MSGSGFRGIGMNKRQRIVKVPKNYYRRVHETRYQKIFGAGAIFRQREMNPFVAQAWEHFCSFADLPPGALGVAQASIRSSFPSKDSG